MKAVEIAGRCVLPATRNKIKKAKGALTYDTFLNAKLFGVLS